MEKCYLCCLPCVHLWQVPRKTVQKNGGIRSNWKRSSVSACRHWEINHMAIVHHHCAQWPPSGVRRIANAARGIKSISATRSVTRHLPTRDGILLTTEGSDPALECPAMLAPTADQRVHTPSAALESASAFHDQRRRSIRWHSGWN